MKSGSYKSIFGSKGQRSTFRRLSGCTYFLTGYSEHILVSFSPYFVHRFRMMKETCPNSFRKKLILTKVSKGRCPKALDDFADFSVVCQVRRFPFAFCYQFLMIFLCFGKFPFDRTTFFTFIILEVEISCRSCKPFLSTYKSFASLHRV